MGENLKQPGWIRALVSRTKQGQLRERRERLAYDTALTKSVLAIIGIALVALLLWLDHKGY